MADLALVDAGAFILDHDGDNPVEGRAARWPRGVPGYRGDLPEDMQARIMAYALVLEIVADADDILIAVEPDADQRLLGAIDVALEVPGCYVIEVAPHPDGARRAALFFLVRLGE